MDSTSEEQNPQPGTFKGKIHLQDFMHTPDAASTESSGRSARTRRRSPRFSSSTPQSQSQSPSRGGTPPLSSESIITTTTTTTSSSSQLTKTNTSRSKSKSKSKKPASYAPPSTYAHLSLLPDSVGPNLLILFVGLNPGVRTANTGHAYAHPSNLFWKLLFSSGVTDRRVSPLEDQRMPALYSVGLTNIVARPSRNGAELSKGEMDDGVAVLEAKARRWRPETVCIVGKSIWESIFRVRKGRAMRKGEFEYGWQGEDENMGVITGNSGGDDGAGDADGEEDGVREKGPWGGARIFVATSTSGLAASVSLAEKERIWGELGSWCVKRREERRAEGAAS